MSKRFKMYPLSVYKNGDVKGATKIVHDKAAQDVAALDGFLPIVDLSQPEDEPAPVFAGEPFVPAAVEPVKADESFPRKSHKARE